ATRGILEVSYNSQVFPNNASWDLGNFVQNGSSRTYNLNLKNTGQQTITINSIDQSNPGVGFSLGTPSAMTIAANQTVTLPVTFQPGSSLGNFSSQLQIQYDDGSGSSQSQALNLLAEVLQSSYTASIGITAPPPHAIFPAPGHFTLTATLTLGPGVTINWVS